ncbi:T9SS type A sorting domain-containing protein [Taibaiella lutea]|nr:T9SS type A sorting domain-containing protein [Taibaiella lutea]
MKKILLLSGIILSSVNAIAQIPNSGFELQNGDGTPRLWRQANAIAIPIDTTCQWIGSDSVRFVTDDAHTGTRALELRVAKYCDFTYGGDIKPVNYDADSFVDQRIAFTTAPSKISFYYKLMPTAGDYARVDVLLEGESGNALADTSIKLTTEQLNWTLQSIPFHYSSMETPVYMTLKLKISSDSLTHYGSRFVMDDFNTESVTGINDLKNERITQLKCFPVPANDKLSVCLSGGGAELSGSLNIIDATGRVVQHRNVKTKTAIFDIASLQSGVYCLVYTSGNNITTCRFTK